MSLLHLLKLEGQRYDGIWRGKVVSVDDPLKLGRVKVRVYPIMDGVRDEDLPWAEPCFSGFLRVPQVGNWVWVMFQEGNVYRPVWLGWSIPFNDTGEGGLSFVENLKGVSYDVQDFIAKGMFEEVRGEYCSAYVFRHRCGSLFVMYDSKRVRLSNDAGAKVVLYENGRIEISNKAGAKIVLYEDGRVLVEGVRIDLNP